MSSFLTARKSGLSGYIDTLISVGKQYSIDPRLFAAMAVAENGQYKNNPFGLGPNGSSTYKSLSDAIGAVGVHLNKYIYK
jgi:hypothetical protein